MGRKRPLFFLDPSSLPCSYSSERQRDLQTLSLSLSLSLSDKGCNVWVTKPRANYGYVVARTVFRPVRRPTKLFERTTANICHLIILLSCSIALPSVYTLRSFISHVPFENSKEQKFLTRVTSCVLGVVPRCRFRRTPRNGENLFDGTNFGFTEITAMASRKALLLRLWKFFPKPRDKSQRLLDFLLRLQNTKGTGRGRGDVAT